MRRRLFLAAAAAAVLALGYASVRAARVVLTADLLPPADCPYGECDGSGLVITVDLTGETIDGCRCVVDLDGVTPGPELREQVRAAAREQVATERLLAAVAEVDAARPDEDDDDA